MAQQLLKLTTSSTTRAVTAQKKMSCLRLPCLTWSQSSASITCLGQSVQYGVDVLFDVLDQLDAVRRALDWWRASTSMRCGLAILGSRVLVRSVPAVWPLIYLLS